MKSDTEHDTLGRMNHRLAITLVVLLVAVSASGVLAQEVAQGPTATPQPVNLSTAPPAEIPVEQQTLVPTSTPNNQVFIEAREFANVRAQPDPSAAQLGQIRAGERYAATGRYFQWIQFEYPPSPTGQGWVFADLVNVTGDLSLVAELTDPAASAPSEADIQSAATVAAVTLTPGGVLTATANSQALGQETLAGPVILPTFTYPPGIIFQPTSAIPIAEATEAPATSSATGSDGVSPIVPILVVGGIGVLGLVINSLRRKG